MLTLVSALASSPAPGPDSQGHTCVNGPAPKQTGILVNVPAMLGSMLPWDLEDHLVLNNTQGCVSSETTGSAAEYAQPPSLRKG